MRLFRLSLALFCCATLCPAQTAVDSTNFLQQARAKYDSPFDRNLRSFTCAVEFDWKRHFSEVVRLGDEGTDEEIAKSIAPIHTRVTVTQQSATVSTGMTEAEVAKLPRSGMAIGLLEHAVRYSLNEWLAASGAALLPPAGTPVELQPTASGYTLGMKVQDFNVEMLFTSDLRLQREGVKGSEGDSREASFITGPQGFLLKSFQQGEDGDDRAGNRIILSYSYHTVGGFQLPEQVAINRESHRENWHYKLVDCTVETAH